MQFSGTQTVAIGPFNSFIITPDWLREQRVVRHDPDDADEIGEGLMFTTEGLEWQVEGHSLSVASAVPEADCGAPVAEVIRLLPHTPVRAIMHTFTYTAARSSWGEGPLPRLDTRPPASLAEYGLEAARWAGLFDRDGARAELTLEFDLRSDRFAVALTYHRRIVSNKSSEAIDAAGCFGRDRRDGLELLRIVLGQEVGS